LTGLAGVILVLGLVAIVIYLVLVNQDLLLYGVPRLSAPLFLVPFLVAVLTLGMIIGVVFAWRGRYWPLWQRLYYTFLTLMAVGFTALLIQSGLMTVL